MFDDNNDADDDSSTETMYHVVDREGDIWWSTEDLTEAQGKAAQYTAGDPDWAPYEVITDAEYDERVNEPDPEEAAGSTMANPEYFDDVTAEADALVEELTGRSQGPYGFFARREPEPEPEDEQVVTKWSLGNHSTASAEDGIEIGEMLTELDDEVDADLKGVLREAAQMVGRDSVHDFECPRCGLTHGHSDDKHDIRSGFNVASKFADEMEFVPYCHCGVNELAMLMDFYGYISEPVFTDAGERFPMVADADPTDVGTLVAVWQDTGEESDVVQAVPFPASETRAFLRRYRQIKGVTAPIDAETRREIADIRRDIEAYIDEQ